MTFNKQQLRASFEAAVDSYDAAAQIQREIGDRLFERLSLLKVTPKTILDIGCGTGHFTKQLSEYYKKSSVIALDLSHGMVSKTRSQFSYINRKLKGHQYICADAEALPLADQSCDMVFSNLTFQWCQDLEKLFADIQRILKPGGVLMFSTLGPDTLMELRNSWAQVDESVHVNSFMDMHDVGDAMLRSQLGQPVIDMEKLTITYDDLILLMKDIKAIGAHNINNQRNHGLTGKGKLNAMKQAYQQYQLADGQYPSTYEVVYGHAWKGERKQSEADGSFAFDIENIGKHG